jgi:DNA repair protein RadC
MPYRHDHAQPALRIRELPPHATPCARLHRLGPSALSDAEVLALIVQAPSLDWAQRLLASFGSWAGLQRASISDLQCVAGIGPTRAAQIKAALEVGRRLLEHSLPERVQIGCPADAAQLMMVEMGTLEQEHLRVMLLDTKNRIQKVHTVYIGSVNSAAIRVAEIFKEPVRLNSTSVIVCHNHPSNDPTPSPEDVAVTRAIVQAGELLDIHVLDHLVICQDRYVSLRERRLGFGV